MAPMQWHDATVSGMGALDKLATASGVDAWAMTARQEPDVRQASESFDVIGLGLVEQFSPVPAGVDLPCTQDPELFFAESPADVEQAKAMCRGCRARIACLNGAVERREPWGVWGGELLLRGTVVPRKRPRGRPRKDAQRDHDEVAA
jgi:WhiB family transcriptional regulator, redox-sensing transcriptional regulator